MPRATAVAVPCLVGLVWLACLVCLALLACGCGGASATPTPITAPDASTDGSGFDDAGAGQGFDSGTEAPSGPLAGGDCVPGDVSSYVPAWHPPSAPQSQCTDVEIDDLLTNCFGGMATATSCDAARTSSPQCSACMVTFDTSATWGPIVVSSYTPFTYGNFAGCLAIETGDRSSGGCGALQQAERVCTEVACTGPKCPSATQQQVDAIAQCVHDAAGAVCTKYRGAEVACVQALVTGGGPAAAAVQYCNQATYGDTLGFYRALGELFCGPHAGLGDGGADGASAADAGDAAD